MAETADLLTIEFSKLASNDRSEVDRLLLACKTHGFFYLSLTDEAFLATWNRALRFMDHYFDQDLETKMFDWKNSDTWGYEPIGTSAGAAKGQLDGYESFKVSRLEALARSGSQWLKANGKVALLDSLQQQSHAMTMTILRCLSDALRMEGDTRFEGCHRDGRPTRSTLALFRYPKQTVKSNLVGHNKHTDLGTLTFLLCQQWGLQVLSPQTNRWGFVAPKKDHAIINVGDSLRFLSGNQLLSAVHRVVPLEELQTVNRHSIVYFLRAEDDAVYTNSNGAAVTAKEWHDEKFDVFRLTHDAQEVDTILCGGVERGEKIIAAA